MDSSIVKTASRKNPQTPKEEGLPVPGPACTTELARALAGAEQSTLSGGLPVNSQSNLKPAVLSGHWATGRPRACGPGLGGSTQLLLSCQQLSRPSGSESGSAA
jgi:hypothetical protein